MNNSDSGIFKTGDLVIGSSDPGKSVYSPTGQKIVQDGVSIYGSESALKDQRTEFVTSVMRNGGQPLSGGSQFAASSKKKTKAGKTQSKKLSVQEYLSIHEAAMEKPFKASIPEVKLETVQFENSFGKIKAKVEHIVEHEQAFMLVFSDEDAVVFEPKIGETLVLHISSRYSYSVYYPGVTFNSPEGNKKFMILFKVSEEE